MSIPPASEGKHVARWRAVAVDIAIIVAFAIIWSGDVRLAILSFLGLVLVLNTVWLVWSTRIYSVLVSDFRGQVRRFYDKRYTAGLLEGFATQDGGTVYYPITLGALISAK